jgi:hypothetical protein
MSLECQNCDKKSLRTMTGKTSDFPELAKNCIGLPTCRGVVCSSASRTKKSCRMRAR